MSLKISIITICYNDISGLSDTCYSLLKQQFTNFEWVVVDGSSKDGTLDYLKKNTVVTKFVSEPDQGIYDAMNKGTAMATGEYVIYMNAGDQFTSEAVLDRCSKYLKSQSLIFCGANFEYGNGSYRYRAPRHFSSIWHSVPANHQAIIFKRECLGESPYDKSYSICGDYELLAQLYIKGYKADLLDLALVVFKVGGVSTFALQALSKEALRVQREVLHLNIGMRYVSWARRQVAMLINLLILTLNPIK